jgi:hypothetical protein
MEEIEAFYCVFFGLVAIAFGVCLYLRVNK